MNWQWPPETSSKRYGNVAPPCARRGDSARVEIDVDYRWSYPPTVNASEPNDDVRALVRSTFGPAFAATARMTAVI